jgi:hypothetical protein
MNHGDVIKVTIPADTRSAEERIADALASIAGSLTALNDNLESLTTVVEDLKDSIENNVKKSKS